MKEKIIGIYKITSPTNRIYIGQATDIKRRFKEYFNYKCKGQIRLYNSLNKYCVENHIFEIIEECNIEMLNIRERYWQDYYDVINKGLNCRLQSTYDKSGKMSEETKLKMRNCRLGVPLTKSHIANLIGFRVNSKLILNLETGIYYDTILEAAKAYNYKRQNLTNHLDRKYLKNNESFIYA